jgi:hypothetical protein
VLFINKKEIIMKVIKIFSSILSFIEINLLFFVIFAVSNYLIFRGEEKTGTIVTIVTVSFFILSIVASSLITIRIYQYLKSKSIKTNMIFFIVVVVVFIGTMLLFNLSSYIIL